MSHIQCRAQSDRVVEVQVTHIDAQVVNIHIERRSLRIDLFECSRVDPTALYRNAFISLHRRIARVPHIARVGDVRTRARALDFVEQVLVAHDLRPHHLRTIANIHRNLRDPQTRCGTVVDRSRRRTVGISRSRDGRQQRRGVPVGLSGWIARVVTIRVEEIVRNIRLAQIQLVQFRQTLEPARVHKAQRVLAKVQRLKVRETIEVVKRDVTVGQAGANETQRRHRRGRRAEPSLRVELEAGAPRHLEAAHTQTFEHTVGQRFDARAFQIDVVDRQALDVTPAKRCDELSFGLETRRLGDPSGTAPQVTFFNITSLTRTATDRTEQFRSRGIRVVIRVLQRGEDIRQNPSLAVQRVAQVETRFRPFHPVARVDRCRSRTAGAAGALPVAIDLGSDGSSYRISICQSVLRVIYRSHHRLRTRRVTNRRCRRGRSVGVEISVD